MQLGRYENITLFSFFLRTNQMTRVLFLVAIVIPYVVIWQSDRLTHPKIVLGFAFLLVDIFFDQNLLTSLLTSFLTSLFHLPFSYLFIAIIRGFELILLFLAAAFMPPLSPKKAIRKSLIWVAVATTVSILPSYFPYYLFFPSGTNTFLQIVFGITFTFFVITFLYFQRSILITLRNTSLPEDEAVLYKQAQPMTQQ